MTNGELRAAGHPTGNGMTTGFGTALSPQVPSLINDYVSLSTNDRRSAGLLGVEPF